MRNKHSRVSPILGALALVMIALVIISPTPARAATWTYTTDFNGFPTGWINNNLCGEDIDWTQGGVLTNFRPGMIAGYGDGSVLSSQYGRKVGVSFQLDEPTTITHVEIIGDMQGATSQTQYVQINACDANGNVIAYVDDSGDPGSASIDADVMWSGVSWIFIYTAPDSGAGYCLVDAETDYSQTPPCFYSWVDAFSITADATSDPFDGIGGESGIAPFVRPVLTADTLEAYTPPGGGNQISVITTVSHSEVFTVMDGVVSLISPDSGAYRVTIANDDYTAYYLNMTDVYPEVGDTVTAGCLLGRVGEQINETTGTYTTVAIGQVMFEVTDGVNSLDWETFPDPQDKRACGDDLVTDNCLNNNPNLDGSANLWQTSGTAYPDNVFLDLGDTMTQDLVLTAATDYYISLIGTTYGSSFGGVGLGSVVSVTIGDVSDTGTFTPKHAGENQLIEIGPLTPTTPDSPPDIYTVTIGPDTTSNYPILITFACVHTGNALVTPDACYFTNPDIALMGGQGWTLGGGATFDPVLNVILIEQNENVSQPISLTSYATTDAEYYIRAMARVYPSDATLDDIESFLSGTYYADLDATIDVEGVPTHTLAQFEINNILIMIQHQDTFTVPVSETWEGDFVLENVSASARSVELAVVCITPVSGVWPGFETSDTGPVVPRQCETCLFPTTLALVEWLNYLACIIRNLWFCYAADLLQRLLEAMQSAGIGLGYLGRFIGALFLRVADWLLSLFGEFGIALGGLLGEILTQLANWLAGLDLLRWLYDQFGLARAGLDRILAILAGIVTLAVTWIDVLSALISVVRVMWVALWAALDSTTATDIGFPVCANPNDPLIAVCWGMDAVDNIVSDIPALVALGYVVAGALGVFVIVWTTRQIGDVLEDI